MILAGTVDSGVKLPPALGLKERERNAVSGVYKAREDGPSAWTVWPIPVESRKEMAARSQRVIEGLLPPLECPSGSQRWRVSFSEDRGTTKGMCTCGGPRLCGHILYVLERETKRVAKERLRMEHTRIKGTRQRNAHMQEYMLSIKNTEHVYPESALTVTSEDIAYIKKGPYRQQYRSNSALSVTDVVRKRRGFSDGLSGATHELRHGSGEINETPSSSVKRELHSPISTPHLNSRRATQRLLHYTTAGLSQADIFGSTTGGLGLPFEVSEFTESTEEAAYGYPKWVKGGKVQVAECVVLERGMRIRHPAQLNPSKYPTVMSQYLTLWGRASGDHTKNGAAAAEILSIEVDWLRILAVYFRSWVSVVYRRGMRRCQLLWDMQINLVVLLPYSNARVMVRVPLMITAGEVKKKSGKGLGSTRHVLCLHGQELHDEQVLAWTSIRNFSTLEILYRSERMPEPDYVAAVRNSRDNYRNLI